MIGTAATCTKVRLRTTQPHCHLSGKLTITSAVSTPDGFNPEFTIINEPDDYYGRVGDTATFIVQTAESGLGYQWLCKAPDSDTFEYLTSSDAYTATLCFELTADDIGAELRCFITDENDDIGNTRVSPVKQDVLYCDINLIQVIFMPPTSFYQLFS